MVLLILSRSLRNLCLDFFCQSFPSLCRYPCLRLCRALCHQACRPVVNYVLAFVVNIFLNTSVVNPVLGSVITPAFDFVVNSVLAFVVKLFLVSGIKTVFNFVYAPVLDFVNPVLNLVVSLYKNLSSPLSWAIS